MVGWGVEVGSARVVVGFFRRGRSIGGGGGGSGFEEILVLFLREFVLVTENRYCKSGYRF